MGGVVAIPYQEYADYKLNVDEVPQSYIEVGFEMVDYDNVSTG